LLNDLAWALSELGDPKATEVAEKAYRQAPYNANVIDTLGWTLVRTGDTKRGVELIHAASNLAPANSEIRLHLATAMVKAGIRWSPARARNAAEQARKELASARRCREAVGRDLSGIDATCSFQTDPDRGGPAIATKGCLK